MEKTIKMPYSEYEDLIRTIEIFGNIEDAVKKGKYIILEKDYYSKYSVLITSETEFQQKYADKVKELEDKIALYNTKKTELEEKLKKKWYQFWK